MIAGIRVGHATDPIGVTGVTVVLTDQPAVAGIALRGGANDVVGLDHLDSGHLVGTVNGVVLGGGSRDRKSTRLNSSHLVISYAVFCLKKKKKSNQYHFREDAVFVPAVALHHLVDFLDDCSRHDLVRTRLHTNLSAPFRIAIATLVTAL